MKKIHALETYHLNEISLNEMTLIGGGHNGTAYEWGKTARKIVNGIAVIGGLLKWLI